MSFLRFLLALLLIPLACTHPDPACAPGKQSARDADCVNRAITDCAGMPDQKRCFVRWKNTCELEEELWVARCTK